VHLTCSKKLTDGQLSPLHGMNKQCNVMVYTVSTWKRCHWLFRRNFYK